MVRVEWQYSQFKNIARSLHFIPGPYFIHTQSAVRSTQSAVRSPQSVVRSPQSAVRGPQSAVRSPQSAVRPQSTVRSRSETLYLAALRTYNAARLQQRHTYQWKNIHIISLKTSPPWYRQALDCYWRSISPRDGSTRLLHQKTTAILFAVPPLPLLPSPPVTVIFGLFSIFVFIEYKNQKTIFISDFIIIDTVSRSFVTHE